MSLLTPITAISDRPLVAGPLTLRAQAHFALSLNYHSIFGSLKLENNLSYLSI